MATESEVKFLGTEGTEQLVANVKDQLADKLSISAHTLTSEQQAQARVNIGITGEVASTAYVDEKIEEFAATHNTATDAHADIREEINQLSSDVADLKEKDAPPYTNQLPIAIDETGAIYNGKGYKENARLNSNFEETTSGATGWFLTGYIPAKAYDFVYLANMEYMDISGDGGDYPRSSIYVYDAQLNHTGNSGGHSPSMLPGDALYPEFGKNGDLIKFRVPNWGYNVEGGYIRLGCGCLNDKSIITVNEPIPEDELEERVSDLEVRVEVLENGTSPEASDIPSYWQAALDDGVEAINTALCEAGRNKSAFLFYTDAHWNYGSQMSPKLLKYLYNHTGMAKTFFGGDIVNNEADDYDTMKYLWDWRNQLKDLPNHHSVVGNHDDGNTTDNLFNEKFVYGYLQAAEETSDIVRGEQGLYYYIDSPSEKTRYLFLDTAFQNIYYYDDQKEFVTNALLTTPDGWHIVAIAHIWYQTDYTSNPPVPKEPSLGGAYLLEQFDNYNSRAGQFADCGGWVEFCIGGHTHWDFDATSATGIPIVLVETDSKHVRSGLGYTAGTTTEASVNGIVADYDAKTIHVIRVGRGESRDITVGVNVITYTNVIPTSIGFDGNVLNADTTPGYAVNSRYSTSSNKISAQTGTCVTGLIPCPPTATIRMRNIATNQGYQYNGAIIFNMNDTDGNGIYYNTYYTFDAMRGDREGFKVVDDENGTMIEFTLPGHQTNQTHIAICSQYIGADSIITVNEEIDSNGGTTDEPDEPVTPDTPEVTYTNVLKTAIDTDGSLYNGGKGYKENCMTSSTGTEDQIAGIDTTGYIAAKAGDVIRFKNVTYKIATNINVVRYRSTFAFHSFTSFYSESAIASWSPIYDGNGNIVQITIPSSLSASCVYFRFNMQDINEKSVITVNEEIG